MHSSGGIGRRLPIATHAPARLQPLRRLHVALPRHRGALDICQEASVGQGQERALVEPGEGSLGWSVSYTSVMMRFQFGFWTAGTGGRSSGVPQTCKSVSSGSFVVRRPKRTQKESFSQTIPP
jgi:hypothetical protein